MNIDNGTDEDLEEGTIVVIKAQGTVVEKGSNFITVETADGDEIDVRDSSMWFVEVIR